jgi:hypothetical protein
MNPANAQRNAIIDGLLSEYEERKILKLALKILAIDRINCGFKDLNV